MTTIIDYQLLGEELAWRSQTARQRKQSPRIYVDALAAIEDLNARLHTAQAQLQFRNSHPYHPAHSLAQARDLARYFPCPATGCRANQWDQCTTVSLIDHDERLTWWLSNGRPVGQ